MKKPSKLNTIALGVGAGAVAGFGWGMGRDAWKKTKEHQSLIILILVAFSAIALPFFGGRNLVRGYPRGAIAQRIWGYLSGALLLGAGTLIAAVFAIMGSALISQSANHATPDFQTIAASATLWGPLPAAICGVIAGLWQRPKRARRFAVAKRNDAFLDRFGIVETGEEETTHLDGEGNPLRLLERTEGALVFLAVGKRSKRAYIRLSPEGEMTGYTGVIPIDAPREYSYA
ncbi:MAG: hypothetical protein K5863_22660 [Nitratireductor sp.]|uniref:hypothetical protein n=1 Tax=Nitratireductor sp. TaxID=1872084 RepID=UPI002636D850|nr:hypothetical protein [Nitratireductor sp.]MCV0352887.1 hypothetical protein [Nitratireductor sp.]